jgi:hypothetical protein
VFDSGDSAPAALEAATASAAPASKPVLKPKQRRSNSVTAMLAISALIAVGGVGFAVGRLASSSTATTGTNTNGGFNGAPRADASGLPADGRGFGLASTVSGTVVSVGTDSFTVKLASGQTVTIATGSSTTYHAQTAGSSTDLTAGSTVLVQTTGGDAAPGASASPGTSTTRTATDVTITAK